jgi:predicted subunit of tRNA(5-methylaminomethyl-2-thiouridylate) methyltransferase
MRAGVLYSGGKDSSLAAMMLGTYYEIELNTFVFDSARTIPSVEAAARALGFPLKKRIFKEGLLNEAVDLVTQQGFPNDAINGVHRTAVESLCSEYRVVGFPGRGAEPGRPDEMFVCPPSPWLHKTRG